MSRVKQSTREIEMMIMRQARGNSEVRKELILLGRRVHRYWRRIAPVGDVTGRRYVENYGGPLPKHWSQTDDEAGNYKAGIIHRAGKRMNGFPSRLISATDYKSHWIEYGTGGKTPTPEFAPRQRTATRFGALGGVSARRGGVDKNPKTKKMRRMGVVSLNMSGRPTGKMPRRGSGYQRTEDAA